jgi:hypothetical protein
MKPTLKLRDLLPMIALAGLVALFLVVGTRPARQKRPRSANEAATSQETKSNNSTVTAPRAEDASWSQPDQSASNEELLELSRTGVRRSPEDALAWAQSQPDPATRERLLFAVLRAWGELDPYAAVNWAMRQKESERAIAVEAALTGAASQPGLALEIGRELLAEDRESGSGYGLVLIGALARAENFSSAMEFLPGAPSESRADWISLTFNLWAQSSPEDAAKAMATFTDAKDRATAFQALVTGWAAANPSGLAAYAVTLPSGEDRSHALDAALAGWCLQDPAAAGDWLNSLPADPEFDQAIARFIMGTDSVNRSPEVAMSWIAGINDPELRRESVLHVMREWTKADSSAAWNYFNSLSWFTNTERENLRKQIEETDSLAALSE